MFIFKWSFYTYYIHKNEDFNSFFLIGTVYVFLLVEL